MTRSESLAASVLKQLNIKVKPQVVIGSFYIADFIGADRPFVLEIDGPMHQGRESYDAKRDALFRAAGFAVVRINNADVCSDTLQQLLDVSIVSRQRIHQMISYAKILTKYPPAQWAEINHNDY